MPTIPQLAYPVAYDPGAHDFLYVEQGSSDDIAGCVQIILRYPLRFLPWLPEFGTRDLAFRQLTDDVLSDVREAVGNWEPRVTALTEQQFRDAVRTVIVTLVPA